MVPLVVENVVKQFRQGDTAVRALGPVSLEVQTGQFLAIMGASGSGKSTLLHLMAGLTRPDTGRIRVNGSDLAEMPDKPLTLFRRRNIGLIFQAFNLIPTLTVEQNIALPLMLEGQSARVVATRVDELLASLGLESRRTHRPDAMSGGEQQRVAIGRAIVADPVILLADEPTGNLDSVNSRSVCEMLRDLSATQQKTVVMVTHEPSVAAYAQEVAILRDGELIERFATAGANSLDLAERYQAVLS